MAAELEEVIVSADVLDFKQFPPDPRDGDFHLAGWSFMNALEGRACFLGWLNVVSKRDIVAGQLVRLGRRGCGQLANVLRFIRDHGAQQSLKVLSESFDSGLLEQVARVQKVSGDDFAAVSQR